MLERSSALTQYDGAPFLFVDLFPFDLGEHPPWSEAFKNPHLTGAILKATDGVAYGYTEWFEQNFRVLTTLGRSERGCSKFYGGYHFLQFAQPGAAQADYYLRTMMAAGWGLIDIMPIVDVELGGERHPNRRASAAQVIDCTSAFAARCKAVTGRRVMLYGRGAMRDLNIRSRMGCDMAWNPSYTERMVGNGLTEIGGRPGPWTLDDIALWQAIGDGVGDNSIHHMPMELVGFGKVDLSIAINGASKVTIADVRSRLL